jgi:hypothetical protein
LGAAQVGCRKPEREPVFEGLRESSVSRRSDKRVYVDAGLRSRPISQQKLESSRATATAQILRRFPRWVSWR